MSKYQYSLPSVSDIPLSLASMRYELRYSATYINTKTTNIEGPHIHDSYEIYAHVSGDASFLVDNGLYHVEPGNLILTKPNTFHHCTYHKSGIMEHFCLWVNPGTVKGLFDFTNSPNFIPLIAFNDDIGKNLLDILYQFKSAKSIQTDASKLTQTALLLQFLSIIHSSDPIPTHASTLPKNFQMIIDELNENFLNYHSIEDISKKFFVSTSTLNRQFRKFLHLSPKEFIDGKKLAFAKDLLKQGSTVTEAGNKAGFFDTSHFISVFKNKFKETPFQYKQRIAPNSFNL